MNHKKALLIFLLLLLIQKLRSQDLIGLQGGLSNNSITTNLGNRSFTSIGSNTGYNFSLLYQHSFNKRITAEIAPNIIQKNYAIDRTEQFSGAYTQYNNMYFQLPLTMMFVCGTRFQVFAKGRVYLAYWYNGQVKGKIPNIFSVTTTSINQQTFQLSSFNEKYQFDPIVDTRNEFGWIGGVGFRYRQLNGHTIFTEFSEYNGLTSQQKNNEIRLSPRYNKTFSLTLGYLFQLN